MASNLLLFIDYTSGVEIPDLGYGLLTPIKYPDGLDLFNTHDPNRITRSIDLKNLITDSKVSFKLFGRQLSRDVLLQVFKYTNLAAFDGVRGEDGRCFTGIIAAYLTDKLEKQELDQGELINFKTIFKDPFDYVGKGLWDDCYFAAQSRYQANELQLNVSDPPYKELYDEFIFYVAAYHNTFY